MLTRSNARWSYYPICWLAVLSLLAHIAFYDWYLLTPIDVGGTFMGGMGGQMFASGWIAATVALLLALLVRMPGSCHACIVAGLLPLLIGGWWQLNYPDDAEQRIYSISPHELGSAMLIGAVFLGLGLFLRSKLKKTRTASGWAMLGRSLLAILIAIVFIGVPAYISKQLSLPHCAFSKDGQQLSVCLGDDDEPVIVD
ncbi:Transmembrane protein [Pseudomonas sp. IT-347P]